MFAVIETGGKQVRVQVGDVVRVERVAGEPGAEWVCDRVLMLGGEGPAAIGTPHVAGARVRGSVVRQGRAKKILVYTYKKTQNSNRGSHGHRQDFTAIQIDAIEPGSAE